MKIKFLKIKFFSLPPPYRFFGMGARESMSREEISREGKLVELGKDSIGGKETSSEIINIRDRRMLGVR